MSRTRSRIRRPVNPNDDPEIQKALGSMTINSSPDEMPRPASSRRKNVPLEKNAKNAIVFTGFGKENIDELKRIAQEFELEISTELDEKKTKCVISRDGHRTLLVVKAICLDIPIVKPIWLEESEEDSKLLDADEYEYGEWKDLLKKRKFSKITFSNYRAIFVHRNCAPKRADICWMIEKCGGKITNKVEKSEIVIAPDNRDEEEETENYRRPVVSPIFVIDSITNNECLGIEDYTN
ncbi:unnamed protein product [Caenorhabditis angaria]|uniref:BRCT domain-containing protein n=1 Tax=Caenorhabditis angaria TaxID=860376 RepID=A0A9P1MSU8_9PELO|nr:unnamed protein product [Caenorhabditis angaria]